MVLADREFSHTLCGEVRLSNAISKPAASLEDAEFSVSCASMRAFDVISVP